MYSTVKLQLKIFIVVGIQLAMLTACSSGSDSNQSPQSTDLGNAVTLSWISPVQNADGSCAHDIRGYQISLVVALGEGLLYTCHFIFSV